MVVNGVGTFDCAPDVPHPRQPRAVVLLIHELAWRRDCRPTAAGAKTLISSVDRSRGRADTVSDARFCPARLRAKPVREIVKDLGISESCLRNWLHRADVDAGGKRGLTNDERAELVRLCRENRVQAMEIEILKRASAYFARLNVAPKAKAAARGRRRLDVVPFNRRCKTASHGPVLSQ